ncbi:MAG: SPOCS domain-containing protein [Cellulosilyticaceae bacterium]
MLITKSANVTEAVVGDIITYVLDVENDDSFDYINVLIKDLLTPELNFVEGSVSIMGIPYPVASILSGIDIGKLLAGAVTRVTFLAEIIASPSANALTNISTGYFKYLTPLGQTIIETVDSNAYTLTVSTAEITVTKTADKVTASYSSIITYTIEVANTGDLDAYSVSFKDIIPTCLTFIPNSFTVDGIVVNDVNLAQGVDLGTLLSRDTVVLTYQGRVSSPTGCEICNTAFVEYEYVQLNGVTGTKLSNASTVCVESRMSFKQLMLDKYCEVPDVKPSIQDLNDEVSVDIQIANSYPIQTIISTSVGGQTLTGYKLIVHGTICISIEYTAALPTHPVHSYHCTLPFGTFIILPADYQLNQQVEVNAIIENVEADMLSPRGVFTNVTLLLIARVR